MSLFKVKQSWLYTSAKRNHIPICRIAGKNYYSKKHIDEFSVWQLILAKLPTGY